MCTVPLPPGVNPIAVNKYIYSYLFTVGIRTTTSKPPAHRHKTLKFPAVGVLICLLSLSLFRYRSVSLIVLKYLNISFPSLRPFVCFISRSQWPRGLTLWSAAARLLRSWVRIPPGGMDVLSVVSIVCCHVEVSATSWSLVQRSPTDCGAWLCVI